MATLGLDDNRGVTTRDVDVNSVDTSDMFKPRIAFPCKPDPDTIETKPFMS
jgi:hypothetical protein